MSTEKKGFLARHGQLERNVTLLAIFAFIAVIFGGIIEIAPVAGSFEPTKPNFQSSFRHAADDETRSGAGRRGGSTVTLPRQERNLA